VQSGQVVTAYQFKTNSGASSLVNRVPADANTTGPKHLSTNIAVPSLNTANSSLYFLPDRVLQRDGKRYSDISYQHLRASGSRQTFIESTGPVPSDGQQVGQTWTCVNVRGGPDHRYANNPLLPVMLYGELDLSSPEGLNWQVQTSRADAAAAIVSVLSTVPVPGQNSDIDNLPNQPAASRLAPEPSAVQTGQPDASHRGGASDVESPPELGRGSTDSPRTLSAFFRGFASGFRNGLRGGS